LNFAQEKPRHSTGGRGGGHIGRNTLTPAAARAARLARHSVAWKKFRPTHIRVYAFHPAVIGRANFLFGRACFYSEDFEGLNGARVAGRRIAPRTLLLLPPLALSRSRLPSVDFCKSIFERFVVLPGWKMQAILLRQFTTDLSK
jgi:hypothetical protein